LGNVAGGVGHAAFFVDFGATRVDQSSTICSDGKGGDCLAIIFAVVRELAGIELGGVGYPDIANSLGREDPGDASAAGCGYKIGRKGRAQHLLETKVGGSERSGDAD
jgi:hypothetical protein